MTKGCIPRVKNILQKLGIGQVQSTMLGKLFTGLENAQQVYLLFTFPGKNECDIGDNMTHNYKVNGNRSF